MDDLSFIFSNIWSVFLVVLFFGGSIFIHELGHFLAAKRRGLKIDRFSIGFGPKLFSWTKNGIEYRISLLPFGGYVALPQLADMSAIEGKSFEQEKLAPISYADKMIVCVMGAVFNVLFALVLATILWGIGQPSAEDRQTTTIGYIPKIIKTDFNAETEGPAFKAGLSVGDQVLAIDCSNVRIWDDIQKFVVTGTGRDENNHPKAIFTIKRNGQELEVPVYPQLVKVNPYSGDSMRVVGIAPAQTIQVGAVMKNSPAEKAGILKNDIIRNAAGDKLYSLLMLSEILNKSQSPSTEIEVLRNNKALHFQLKPEKVAYTKKQAQLNILSASNSLPYIRFLTSEKPQVKKTQVIVFEKQISGIPAIDSHIQEGDTLTAINKNALNDVDELINFLDNHKTGPLELEFSRLNSAPYSISLVDPTSLTVIQPETQAMIGIELKRKNFLVYISPIAQFSESLSMTFRTLSGLLNKNSDLKLSNLMGPPGIIRVFHNFSSEDFRLVIWFTIFVNINLAFLNLMPIPVLDGGHMAFATIAKLIRRPLPAKFIFASQSIFMVLLFSLMIYVSFFDVRRWQGDNQMERRMQLDRELYVPVGFNKE